MFSGELERRSIAERAARLLFKGERSSDGGWSVIVQGRSVHECKAGTACLTFSEQDLITSNLQIKFKITNRKQNRK